MEEVPEKLDRSGGQPFRVETAYECSRPTIAPEAQAILQTLAYSILSQDPDISVRQEVLRAHREERPGISPTVGMNEIVDRMWKKGLEALHLGLGEARHPVHPAVLKAGKDHLHEKGYGDVQGLFELREAAASRISRFNVNTVEDPRFVQPSSSDVVISIGAKSMLFALETVLLREDPNSATVVIIPGWVTYEEQIKLLGKNIVCVFTREENGYLPTPEEIEAAMKYAKERGLNVKAVLINNPNNPTGCVLSRDQVKALAEKFEEHGVWVISDEIYWQTTFKPGTHVSFAEYYNKAIVVDAISKIYAAGGWRVGINTFPPTDEGIALRQKIVAAASSIWTCVPVHLQWAALEAIKNPEARAHYARGVDIHRARTMWLHEKLEELGLTSPEPGAGFYLYVNFESWREALEVLGITTSAELADFLLIYGGIAVLPGEPFGDDPNRLVVRMATSFLDQETWEKAKELFYAYPLDKEGEDIDKIDKKFVEEFCPNVQRVAKVFRDLNFLMHQISRARNYEIVVEWGDGSFPWVRGSLFVCGPGRYPYLLSANDATRTIKQEAFVTKEGVWVQPICEQTQGYLDYLKQSGLRAEWGPHIIMPDQMPSTETMRLSISFDRAARQIWILIPTHYLDQLEIVSGDGDDPCFAEIFMRQIFRAAEAQRLPQIEA